MVRSSRRVSSLPSANGLPPNLFFSAHLVSFLLQVALWSTDPPQPMSSVSSPRSRLPGTAIRSDAAAFSSCSGKVCATTQRVMPDGSRSTIGLIGYAILLGLPVKGHAGVLYFAVFLTVASVGPLIGTTIAWTANTWGNHCPSFTPACSRADGLQISVP